MKKVMLMVAMALTMGMHAYALENDSIKFNYIDKYDLNVNHRRLACVLDLSESQMKSYDEVIRELERDMIGASMMDDKDISNGMVSDAVKKNFKYMRHLLKKEQYEKYFLLINLTLEHRGFDLKNF